MFYFVEVFVFYISVSFVLYIKYTYNAFFKIFEVFTKTSQLNNLNTFDSNHVKKKFFALNFLFRTKCIFQNFEICITFYSILPFNCYSILSPCTR